MKLNKIIAVAVIFALVLIMIDIKATPATNIITVAQSTKFQDNLFAENRTGILQSSQSDLINFGFDNKKSSLCRIDKGSAFTDWVNLFGRLLILISFGYIGVKSNSDLIERYIKLIFQDVIPMFLIIFFSISLLSIASAIAVISFSSPASLTTSSLSSQNSCILK